MLTGSGSAEDLLAPGHRADYEQHSRQSGNADSHVDDEEAARQHPRDE
jgi:hypothetical protein